MRNRWRLQVYPTVEGYPFDGIMSPRMRRRMLRWRLRLPVLLFEGGINLTCPDCGGWRPITPAEGYEVTGLPERPSCERVLACAIRLAQEAGRPYPETRCPGGRFLLDDGVLHRVRVVRRELVERLAEHG